MGTWDLVHDRIDDLGVVVACINSSIYVCKDSEDEQRGQVDDRQLETSLPGNQPKRKSKAHGDPGLGDSTRDVHHHPVLIPSLAEPGRGYDAVMRSAQLITILKEYGFHLLLHGHKHHPHVFTEDVRNAF